MKKISLLFALLFTTTLSTMADEQKSVNLSGDHTQQTVALSYMNIFVTLEDNDGETGKVKLELENLDESKALLLFDRAYDEKTVKKMPVSMTFDKTFGGTKNKRVIDPYEQANQPMMLKPSDKFTLPLVEVQGGTPAVCRLPIYIAKFKGKKMNKLILMEKEVIELSIEVELKPSAEYLGLKDEVDALSRSISICPNSKHKPTEAKQREDYQDKINSLKQKIDAAIQSHGWPSNSRAFARYSELKKSLDGIDLDSHVRDCGRHKTAAPRKGHSCSYCSLSLQQIYHQLDDIYKRIYSSSDRKAAKAKVMGQVNALYRCCTDGSCSKHASSWKSGGGGYKAKITERYNRINGI